MTPAESETRIRRGNVALDAIETAMGLLRVARQEAWSSVRQVRKGDAEASDAAFRRASEQVMQALETLENPTEPGVEAKDLPMRSGASRSVQAPFGVGRFAWMTERTGVPGRLQRMRVADGMAAMGVSEKGLTSTGILRRLAESGYDDEELANYIKGLLELTKEEGTIRQRSEVTKLLMTVLQHTEPRTLFEMKDVDLADLSDEEIQELTLRAAQYVAEQKARLQAGLSRDNVEK